MKRNTLKMNETPPAREILTGLPDHPGAPSETLDSIMARARQARAEVVGDMLSRLGAVLVRLLRGGAAQTQRSAQSKIPGGRQLGKSAGT